MPYLNRPLIKEWLTDHNWSVGRLADECHVLDPDDLIPEGVMRNAVNGIDPMRIGRIKVIARVTDKYQPLLPLTALVAGDDEDEEGPKTETTGPKRRENGAGTGPKKLTDEAAA